MHNGPQHLHTGPAELKGGGACPTVGQDCQKCKETSNLDVIANDTFGPLADKQQKTGERVESIKSS